MSESVDSVVLGGVEYRIEQPGADALRAYLEGAAESLVEEPGLGEIIADLERTIAEKLDSSREPDGSVSADSVDRILKEIGPVSEETEAPRRTRKLYRLELDGDNLRFFGLCTGVAAYYKANLAVVRLITLVLVLLTGGFIGFIVYALVSTVIPKATTYSEEAAAFGSSSDGPEVIDRLKGKLKKQADGFSSFKYWGDLWGHRN